MNKAFTREPSGDEDEEGDDPSVAPIPAGTRNYLTPAGYKRLREELMDLLDNERPKIVEIVSWAAKNGDRSENGDYLYGKKRLRAELMSLLDDERPKIVEIVSWAAKNGDRSENGDYLYGKKRLRENSSQSVCG